MRELVCCRICGSAGLIPFFSMGDMPLANGLLDTPDQPEERYPLKVLSCERCGLVQLSHVVPAETLFAHDYPFFTGSSAVMSKHFIDLMDAHTADLPANALVVEIGANDCTAFRGMKRLDLRRVAVDPADNMPVWGAHVAHQLKECFTEDTAKGIVGIHGKASLIVACNVLGHVDDLHEFMRGVTALLTEDGSFVFEVPYFGDTYDAAAYDQIYHEHLSFFTYMPLVRLLNEHRLRITGLLRFGVHGGTIRITAARTDDSHQFYSPVEMNRDLEDFANRAQASRARLRDKLLSLKADGKSTVAYGASAKGAVVLNYCGIGTDLVSVVVDNTPAKRGKFMPGTHQLVADMGCLSGGQWSWPDAILLLAWNHAAEIKAKHPDFKGEWILPHGEA